MDPRFGLRGFHHGGKEPKASGVSRGTGQHALHAPDASFRVNDDLLHETSFAKRNWAWKLAGYEIIPFKGAATG
jgi:hypothetical protein